MFQSGEDLNRIYGEETSRLKFPTKSIIRLNRTLTLVFCQSCTQGYQKLRIVRKVFETIRHKNNLLDFRWWINFVRHLLCYFWNILIVSSFQIFFKHFT